TLRFRLIESKTIFDLTGISILKPDAHCTRPRRIANVKLEIGFDLVTSADFISTYPCGALGCLHAHIERARRSMEVCVGKPRSGARRGALHSRRSSSERPHRENLSGAGQALAPRPS